MSRRSAEDVLITGLGMSTPLGSTVTACAAARAGIAMPRELDDLTITGEDGSDAPIVGHPVVAAAGFRGTGKLVCLGLGALGDLLELSDVRAEPPEKLGFYLCLRARPEVPSPGPDFSGAAGGRPDDSASQDARRLSARLLDATSLLVPRASVRHLTDGHAGFVSAIADASARLRSGEWHRCLVGGVDSLLETAALHSLYSCGRLKTRDKPDGFLPGEAGAFVLLERRDAAARRKARGLAVVAGASLAMEPRVLRGEKPCVGVGLSEAFSAGLRPWAVAERGRTWLLSDHNGEHSRAMELGGALARVSREVPELREAIVSHPAESFGETGAASAAVAACLVTRAFVRGYAPHPRALILSSSETELRGVLSLRRDVA